MRRLFILAFSLLLSFTTVDATAQGFLKQLGKAIDKEIRKEVDKEAKKQVNKMKKEAEKALTESSENQQQKEVKTKTTQEQKQQDQSQPAQSTQPQKSNSEIQGSLTETVLMADGPTSGTEKGHQWVDMGLPSGTRWATCNLDASSPSQPGKLYAWGEITSKTTFSESNYKLKNVNYDIAGDFAFDAATKNWGGGWRMPTAQEFGELVFYCDWKYEKEGGRWGVRFTSPTTKKSIFLPATGYKYGNEHDNANTCGNYWTSTPVSKGACMYRYGAALGELSDAMLCCGLAIRPVLGKATHIETPVSGTTSGYDWVDLGLPSGNKWATCNVGAKNPDEIGKYYAWGEVTPSTDRKSKKNDLDSEKNAVDIAGKTRYDAARYEWGNRWRMPSRNDFQELLDNCVWEWVSAYGRKGFKVTSKINGNWLFLPATGMACDPFSSGQYLSEYIFEFSSNFNDKGVYWTSTPEHVDWGYTYDSYNLYFSAEGGKATQFPHFSIGNRTNSYCIRPVTSEVETSSQNAKTSQSTSGKKQNNSTQTKTAFSKQKQSQPVQNIEVVNVESDPQAPIFLGIPVKGSIDDMVVALQARGYEKSKFGKTLLLGDFKGLPSKLHIFDNDKKQVCHIQIQPQTDSHAYLDEIGVKLRFNELLDDYGNDSRYVAHPDNKKIPNKESVANEMNKDKMYKAKFYEGGDKKKIVSLSIHEYEGKYYVAIHYYNCYLTSINYDEWT